MTIFADLHNHPLARAFNCHRNTPVETNNNGDFHGWNIPPSKNRPQRKGKRAFSYSQCDLAKLTKGKVRLVFASLYPLEKGFVIGNHARVSAAIQKLVGVPEHRRSYVIAKYVKEQSMRTPLLEFFQSNRMGMSQERMNYLQSINYDYFNELQAEYNFYKKKNGIETRLTNYQFEDTREDIVGKYRIARNGQEISEVIHGDPDDISVVLTVEGMHSLGIGYPKEYGEDASLKLLKERIKVIKGGQPGTWEYPVFYITFAHHFSNRLCGHAHSIPSKGALIFNQKEQMDEGFTDIGLELARDLLGLDKDLNDTGSRRILLDVKHMSAASREDYYTKIVKPYNRKHPERKIPIIASHVGYSGCTTLQELKDGACNEKDNTNKKKFLAWNINICDDDIAEIHNSGGLIGLSFDQRILGIDRTFLKLVNLPREKFNDITGFMRMLEHLVSVPYKRQLHKPEQIWKTITIGTDYEGFIDPVDDYPTVLKFEKFEKDLSNELDMWRKDSRAGLLYTLNIKDIVDGVCFRNAYDFVKKHFV